MLMPKIRAWAQAFIYLDLLSQIALALVLVVVGSPLFVALAWWGQSDLLGPLAFAILHSLAFLGLLLWLGREARRASLAPLHRKEVRPAPDGDMSDVAGVLRAASWTGM